MLDPLMLGSSARSFENPVDEGVEHATGTLRNVESAWVKDVNVLVQTATSPTTRQTWPSRSSHTPSNKDRAPRWGSPALAPKPKDGAKR